MSTELPLSGSTEPGLWQVTQYSTERRGPPCISRRSWQVSQVTVAATSLLPLPAPPLGTTSFTGLSGASSSAAPDRRTSRPRRCVRFGSNATAIGVVTVDRLTLYV